MRIRTTHRGRALPFERDRRLVLRRLPVGAVVRRAVLTLTPVSTDTGSRFLESLALVDGLGDWGAVKARTSGTPGAVEVDLHARRRLAAWSGTGVGAGTLLVDLGGGFMAVDAAGGIGDGAALALQDAMTLPGLTVTGLRVAGTAAGADLARLTVASPPSGVTVALEGGPVFFARSGDLVEPVTTPDFADLLMGMLTRFEVVDGCHVVPFVVHSDSIARLDVDLEIEHELAVPATPDGVASVQAAYAYDGTPVGGQGRLLVPVPGGMVAVTGGTAGRAQGGFGADRVVFGPLTTGADDELVPVTSGQSLAQAFVLPATQVVTSVDVRLTAVTASVGLALDLVDDLDGKPGRRSALARPATLTLTRDAAGRPTWVSVPLPGEVEVAAGQRRWVVLQVTEGSAAWSASSDDGRGGAGPDAPTGNPALLPGPGLQHTRDGGLSWRVATPEGAATAGSSGLRAELRLRHTTPGFHMPLELRASAGGPEVAVSLQRFAAAGTVDVDLGFDDVAHAVNTALADVGAGAPAGGGERVANGDFVDWFRVGTAVGRPTPLRPTNPAAQLGVGAFGPDSATAYTAVQVDGVAHLLAFDVFSGAQEVDGAIGDGTPSALALDPTGATAVVALDRAVVDELGTGDAQGTLVLVDTATGRPVGQAIVFPDAVARLVPAQDGLGVYVLAWPDRAQLSARSALRHVPWSDLRAAAAGTVVDWAGLPTARLAGFPRDLASGPGGRVVALLEQEGAAGAVGNATVGRLVTFADRGALAGGVGVQVDAVADARAVAVAPTVAGSPTGASSTAAPAAPAAEVLTLADDRVRFSRVRDLSTVVDVPLEAVDAGRAQALAVDASGTVALAVRSDAVAALDVPGRRLVQDGRLGTAAPDGASVAISAAGTHALLAAVEATAADLVPLGDALPVEWELTAGTVRPYAVRTTGELFALLGDARARRVRTKDAPETVTSALSQVVPAVGGARYRFAFDGLTTVEGAVAQVRWAAGACTAERVDRVPVTVFDPEEESALAHVPHHEVVLVAPAGAVQAEVRILSPEGFTLVDKVSLLGTADLATATWSADAPTTTVTTVTSPLRGGAPGTASTGGADAPGRPVAVTFTNGGAAPSTVTQIAPARPGDRWDLQVSAHVDGPPDAHLDLVPADDTGTPVGETVTLPLDSLDFDARSAGGTVPAGAAELQLRLVLPPGAVVDVDDLALAVGPVAQVEVYFASDAPGELRVSDVTVRLDDGVPTPPPVPEGGLCPPTPTGEDGECDDCCYCQSCGTHAPTGDRRTRPAADAVVASPSPVRPVAGARPTAQVRAATTPAGRPAAVSACPTCGADRVRLGGQVVAGARTLALPRFRAVDRVLVRADGPARAAAALRSGVPAIVARTQVDAALSDIDGIADTRATALTRAGITDVVALARADVAEVAALPGVSDRMAETFVAEAAALVRARGRRTLVD